MNSKTILKKINDQKSILKKKGVKKIGLFGSYLTGKNKSKSDIDLIVEFDKVSFQNYMDLLFMFQKLFNKKIDLVIEKNIKPELDYVKKEAQYVKI